MIEVINHNSKMTEQQYVIDTFSQLVETIRNIDNSTVPDIYVISFWISNDNDDPRLPLLTVGYNTYSRWTACTPTPGQKPKWPVASNSNEAKWNFAFWLQNEILIVGGEGFNSTTEWVKGLPFYYSNEQQEQDFDKAMELAGEIQEKFIQIIVGQAKKLHSDGIILQKFGREIPIIIHELEYYDEPLNWTREANPKELITEFENWIDSLKQF